MNNIAIKINGVELSVAPDITVAAVLANSNKMPWRVSVGGEKRAPFCGMGVCFECRVRVDGLMQRSCQLMVRNGMEISIDD